MSDRTDLPLFVFGTLRDPLVLSLVLGRGSGAVATRAAELPGHVTVTLPGETYPVLQACPDARVCGLLLEGLQAGDMSRIEFFEGEEYAFEVATVHAAAGPVTAQLCAERSARPGERRPWRLEQWQRDHRAGFLPAARDYMALFGCMSVAEADVRWRELAARAGR
jgi:hypothetical protein